MEALAALADPARRRILELLAEREQPAGALVSVLERELGLSQPRVSQHLRTLREQGLVTVRADGTRRLYSLVAGPLLEADAWLDHFRHVWARHLDALATEVARG